MQHHVLQPRNSRQVPSSDGNSDWWQVFRAGTCKLQPVNHRPITHRPNPASLLFVNNALLEHSQAHSFLIVRGCFHPTGAELSSCNKKLYGPQTLKYLLSSLLQKMFADSWSRVLCWEDCCGLRQSQKERMLRLIFFFLCLLCSQRKSVVYLSGLLCALPRSQNSVTGGMRWKRVASVSNPAPNDLHQKCEDVEQEVKKFGNKEGGSDVTEKR